MTPRERFINALLFKPVDRIPLVEWPIRGATMSPVEIAAGNDVLELRKEYPSFGMMVSQAHIALHNKLAAYNPF